MLNWRSCSVGLEGTVDLAILTLSVWLSLDLAENCCCMYIEVRIYVIVMRMRSSECRTDSNARGLRLPDG